MPSPFPGMDPYLEDPGSWPDLHHRLISHIGAQLGRTVRPKYVVRVEDRVYITGDDASKAIVPDVHLRRAGASGQRRPRRPVETTPAARGPDPGGGTAAVAVAATTAGLGELEGREARLQVLDRRDRRVVTVIEILSPANKVAGSEGWASFDAKRREVIASTSHWVEVDLLRGGKGVETREPLPPHDYLVYVSRADRRPPDALAWPVRLSQPLPVVPIPLAGDDPDVPVDLQAALTAAYDEAGYDLDVDYRLEPVPPLEDDWAAWSDRRLRAAGLRPRPSKV